MPFIKQRHGLLEEQDFYLTSDFADFLVSGEVSRKDGTFTLKSGTIKRHFTYESFVIDVQKEYKQLTGEEQQAFFLETDRRIIGLYDCQGDGYAAYWRILCHDRFVQAYKSADGQEWVNVGGTLLENDEPILYQGFRVQGGTALKFTRYTVYQGPYLTLQNFPEGFKAELCNTEGSPLRAALFDGQMTANIFLGYGQNGILIISDAADNVVYEAPAADYTLGEIYTYTAYLLEILYDGEVINYGPTQLDEKPVQRMILRNASANETYTDVTLAVSCVNGDQVQMSLDGTNYGEQVTVDTLAAGEEKPFYVKIGRKGHSEFEVRYFEITIL